MSGSTPPAKPTADWERIEADYRVGVRSLREIAAAHSITEGAIRKRAKRDGWTKNLAPKVRAKADALVRKETVRTELVRTDPAQSATAESRTSNLSEKITVDIEATVQSRIRLSHRTDIAKSRALVVTLMDELKAETERPEPKKVTKATPARLPLSTRTTIAKSLAEALKTTIGLEREAYAIVSDANLENPIAKLISQLGQTTLPVATQDPDFDE